MWRWYWRAGPPTRAHVWLWRTKPNHVLAVDLLEEIPQAPSGQHHAVLEQNNRTHRWHCPHLRVWPTRQQLVLEKSLDYGRTWQPYQFYASDCLDAFTMEPKAVHQLTPSTMLEIICTEAYSTGYVWKYDKTVRFEIKDRFALLAGPRLHNMASLYGQLDTTKNLRDFFTLTDLRIRLLRPATGATMVDENNLSRYFYAISDIKVQGR